MIRREDLIGQVRKAAIFHQVPLAGAMADGDSQSTRATAATGLGISFGHCSTWVRRLVDSASLPSLHFTLA